ncbi:MAG TPA: Rpn family recombination-promoting nuclease/putative transposase [Kofleriaceae bacterium]|nr:Rpn family recombination-promoting nuclease/putative transposase [Kofleriaceae bacterium]
MLARGHPRGESFMQRPTFADPRTDFVFKRIFGSEKRKDVLIAFLNAMLDLDADHRITEVELLPPEQRPAVAELKLSIIDVRCKDARGVSYVVEMQVLQVEGFERRVVDNVDKVYVNQTARDALYPQLNDVVGITICDFELWPDQGERKIPMLSRWRMTEQATGARELGQIQLVFLELPKYDASQPPRTVVEKWAYFFREADNLAVVPEVLAEHPFIEALEAARLASFTVAEWDPYILAGIAIQNQRGALAVAERRGLQRGLRHSIEALCAELGIELTDARQRELTSLDTAGLEALLTRLGEQERWT